MDFVLSKTLDFLVTKMLDVLLTKIVESWDTPTNFDEKMNDLQRKLERLNALKEDTVSTTSMELHPRKKQKKEELWFRDVERINDEIQDQQKIGERNVVLKRKLEGLYALNEDTVSTTSTELHPRKKQKKGVELWCRDVERMNDEIQDLQQKIGESNVVTRGFLKRNALKKIQEVEELFQQGNFHGSLVVDNPGWIGQILPRTTLFGGAAKICMEEIWACLMASDVQKIGVWGMGGIGKTAIMKLIHNQILKIENFDIVIWITVSKDMSIIKIQDRIARAMNVTLDEDEIIRASMIHDTLARKGKYAIILDDLWDKCSLEEIGIPEPSNGSKLLITTRSLDVCHYMDCREVKIHSLSKEDSWRLFLENVGQDVLNHPDLLPLVKHVAEQCSGLPLAIVTLARCMKGVYNIHEWRNAVHELQRQVRSVNEMQEMEVALLQGLNSAMIV